MKQRVSMHRHWCEVESDDSLLERRNTRSRRCQTEPSITITQNNETPPALERAPMPTQTNRRSSHQVTHSLRQETATETHPSSHIGRTAPNVIRALEYSFCYIWSPDMEE